MKNKLEKNIILIISLFVFAGIFGFFLGQYNREEAVTIIQEKTEITKVSEKSKPVNVRAISSIIFPEVKGEKKQVHQEKYLEEFLSEEENRNTYNKVLDLFNNTPNKESLALWISLGNSLTNSLEYSKLFEKSLQKINENPDETLSEISNKVCSFRLCLVPYF